MFSINPFNQLEPLSVYVVKPTGEILGCLDDEINESTGSLTVGLNQQYELTFEIHKTENSIWFDYLQEGMYLLLDKIGLFKMRQPEMSLNGYDDVKNITTFSCDVELEDKNCEVSINMGTKVSQEYLISDSASDKEGYLSYIDSENTTQYELIKNPYTNLPYDWIYLHNVIPAQLREFKTKYFRGDYGTLDGDERTITSEAQIENFQKYIDIVPRLKHKFTITTVGSNDEYSINEYISYTYTNETITAITINSETDFKKRINDLILFYTKYCKQLSLLDIVLEEMGGDWTVGDVYGEGVVQEVTDRYALSNKKFQFEISENIYSFLTQTLADTIKCVVNFDIINRKVNITPVEKIGKDTGIVMAYDTLINSMNITCEEENLSTRLYAKGANDLNLSRANYGLEYVEDLSYKMNAKDKDEHRIYVSDELATKYETYISYLDSHRADYIQYSKDIDRLNKEINEIKYRVPADDLKTDWGTFKKEELEANLTAYKNLMATLKSLYKEDFGDAGCNLDGSINENYIKNTIYWYDYEAYKSIINEIECAIATFPYYSDQDKWTDANITEYKAKIKAWETEWSLYGTIELQNKIDIYKGNMDLLAEKSVIRLDATAEKTALDTAKSNYERDKDSMTDVQKQAALADIATKDRAFNVKYYNIKTWSNLTDDEKAAYGGTSANYYYDKYMEYYNFFIGNANNAYDYLVTLKAQIDALTTSLNDTTTLRTNLNKQASLSGFTNGGENPYFTESEIKIISRLYRDADYTNENILTTNISTTDEVIDICSELLEDAKDQVSICSRPQLNFAVEAENILALPDYKAMWADFKGGNYMMVQYRDDTYVKLRIVAFTFNPFLPTSKDFKVEFSNYTRSRVLISDTSFLLGQASSTSSRSSSSSGGSGNGNFGESDDIDITISNTMLAQLLKSESFGTRVTNVILDTLDVNALTAKSATFQGLANGTTTIDGGCITTGAIKSNGCDATYDSNNKKYNLNNTIGSLINMVDGTFRFGGGKLQWDNNSLSVEGAIKATTLSSGNRTSASTGTNGAYIDTLGNIYSGSSNQTQIKADGSLSLGSGKLTYDSTNGLVVNGAITATSLNIANNATITGSIPANNISGLSSVATSGNYSDLNGYPTSITDFDLPNGKTALVYSDDFSVSNTTTANGVTTRTITVNGQSFTEIEDGDFIFTAIGIGTSNANENDLTKGYFKLEKSGLLVAKNIDVQGRVVATSGTFRGEISVGGKLTANTNSAGLYIGTNGDLRAGASNEVQINANGSFSLGATNGTKLTYDSTNGLVVNGAITATSLSTNNKTSASTGSGIYIDNSGNLTAGANKVNINADGTFNFNNKIVWNGTAFTIDGYATIASLGAGGTTTIDGGRISGGIISLGGANNGNGVLKIYNASGTEIGSWTNNGINATAINISTTGTSSKGTDMIFSISNGRVYSDSSVNYETYTGTDNVDRNVTYRATYDNGMFECFGDSGNPKFLNDSPLYWATFNACGIDLAKLDAPNTYSAKFAVDIRTTLNEMYCRIPAHFDGTIYDKNGSVVTGSDINIKNSISNLNIQATANFIYSLNPVKFKYNEGTSNRFHHGLIAQSVKSIMDNMNEDWGLYIKTEATPRHEGFCALRYEELIPDVIATLQYQKQIIDQLQNKVEELKRGNDNNE